MTGYIVQWHELGKCSKGKARSGMATPGGTLVRDQRRDGLSNQHMKLYDLETSNCTNTIQRLIAGDTRPVTASKKINSGVRGESQEKAHATLEA